MTRLWAGVDIGGTKTAVVISSKPPQLLGRIEFATLPALGPEQAIERIVGGLRILLAEAAGDGAALVSVGVSCGGPLDAERGVIQAPPNLWTWTDVPIREILHREFGCPVHLENDANAGAMAEHRFGAGRGTRNMVFLTMGTGLGGGIILNGEIYRGTSGMAGEIGHVRLTEDGPVGYFKAGSAEGWASGGGLAQTAIVAARKAQELGEASVLAELANAGLLTAKDVGQAAKDGDALACRLLRECGEKLGLALAILVDILNPERIVIGGLALRLGDLLLEPARRKLAEEALEPAAAVCRIVPAELGERIGDVAALCVAMQLAQQ